MVKLRGTIGSTLAPAPSCILGRGKPLDDPDTFPMSEGNRMRLGIDFGTTRIVAAAADRGNYPILTFETREGAVDWFPSLAAFRGAERRYGWEAWAMQGEPGWTVVRSLKRILENA